MLLELFTVEGMVGLVTLIMLEIVLGIDNIIFIAILCSYLPLKEQRRARTIGLMLAMVFRIILLLGISWLVRLTNPLFQIGILAPSGRDLILFAGGVFLVYKTIREIYHKLRSHDEVTGKPIEKKLTVSQAILQITIIDIIFSFDSILTAVGLSRDLTVMITAVVISMIVMLLFAPYVSNFINNYPTLKMLALAFLVCIGFLLIIESFHFHLDKSYIYFAMAFSLGVELLNIRMRKLDSKKE
ncbi:MAG TPA: TerC family protein [Bacteroidia bacterium]|nr:TerC family protein [Bacteroidia bacterium]HNS11309.1 TerC family protein [Bacteroidia bacterium]